MRGRYRTASNGRGPRCAPTVVQLLRTELQRQSLDGLGVHGAGASESHWASTGRVPASLPPTPRMCAPEWAVFTFSPPLCPRTLPSIGRQPPWTSMPPPPESTVRIWNSVGVGCRGLGTGCSFFCNVRRTVPGVLLSDPSARSRVLLDVGDLRPGTGPAPGVPASEVLPLLQVPEYSGPCFMHDNFPVNRGTPYRVEL